MGKRYKIPTVSRGANDVLSNVRFAFPLVVVCSLRYSILELKIFIKFFSNNEDKKNINIFKYYIPYSNPLRTQQKKYCGVLIKLSVQQELTVIAKCFACENLAQLHHIRVLELFPHVYHLNAFN